MFLCKLFRPSPAFLAVRFFGVVNLHVCHTGNVGADVQVACRFLSAFGAVLVQPVCNLVAGIGILLFVVLFGHLVVERAVRHAAGGLFKAFGKLGGLVQRPLHVRAHGAGEGPGPILALAEGTDCCLARHGGVAAQFGVHVGQGDVCRHAGADGRVVAGSKGAGPGLVFGIFRRVDQQVAGGSLQILFCDFLFFAVLPGFGRAGGHDPHALRDGGLNIIVQHVQAQRHVQAGVLDGGSAFKRIRSGGGEVLFPVLGIGRHGNAAGGYAGIGFRLAFRDFTGAAFADFRLHGAVAPCPGKRAAPADAFSGSIR